MLPWDPEGGGQPGAPDAALTALLLDALPPLHRQVRRPAAAALAARVARLPKAPAVATPQALLEALSEVLLLLDAEAAEVEEATARFSRRYAEAREAGAQRAVLLAHLEETVADARERRKDVRALERWLGFDALKERLDRRRHQLHLQEETALRALPQLLRALSTEARAELGPALRRVADHLLVRAQRSPRPQNQLAALEALEGLLEGPSPQAAALAASAALSELVLREGTSPFLQAQALHLLLRTDAAEGRALLHRRLRDLFPSPRDFLFRRQALEQAAPLLMPEELLGLLDEVSRTDPSESVRMGAAGLLVPHPGRTPLLRRLAGLVPEVPERSPRVRTSAVLAAVAVVRQGLPGADAACALLLDVLREEQEALVLRVACEQVAGLAEAVPEGAFGAAAPALLGALRQLQLREGIQGPVLEAAAATEQVLRRLTDGVRLAWTRHLLEVVRKVPVGGKVRVALEPPPPGLPRLPEDPTFLGAILADLSANDYGLYVRRERRALRVWRGDQYRRRMWRVWHELLRPAPNKRQAFLHTVGRVIPGELRAHPGHLDEITETLVPGERVHVAREGSWGRHLPTVDDLLDLPLGSPRPVRIFSSHGTTTLTPPASLARRLGNRLRLTRDYQRLASLRLSSLNGSEPRERRRYAEHVAETLGVTVEFAPYDAEAPVPAPLGQLFGGERAGTGAGSGGGVHALLPALALLDSDWLTQLGDRLAEGDAYFLSPGGNGMVALGLFTAGAFTLFLGDTYRKRQSVRRARSRIPLCIGGWGTRGKSGTERLKAALFTGLGFDIFAKTTGSEAMFVHGAPGAAPSEFFIFRPYDKATIWEQRDMVELAERLGVEVFLWECMALQPAFVDLLQNDWMHDDLATLTNAYPDHEDIQGPAGINVASVITNFMPRGGKVVTTEDHFLPLFEEAARDKGTQLLHSPWWEAELIPEELLALFPYREHPRNMALVATLGEQLGIPRPMALALMAEFVQPEIGVLKVFPQARVRGRVLTFINGHSANERTGFLNNWVRTGLDKVDPEAHPERAVLTVINNRWDRVARSEVFARIMVEDAAADRHVLIGTNLEGLQKYVRDALEQFLARTEVVAAEDLASEAGRAQAEARLTRELARLKVPRPSAALFLERLGRYAGGAGLTLARPAELTAAVEAALAADEESVSVARVREQLAGSVGPLIDAALVRVEVPPDEALPEVLAAATPEEVRTHALYLLARLVVHARLRRALPAAGDGAGAEGRIAAFHQRFREAYRELYLEQLVPVHDSHATGDQVVDACARCVPPGMQVSIMGAQNIKGTGLDWVYRWVALDKVRSALEALARGPEEARRRALDTLESFEDHGIVDAGLARSALPRLAVSAHTPEDGERLRRLAERARATHEARVAALQHTGSVSRLERAVRAVEKAFDYLDSVQRRRISDQLLEDLVEGRISHARAAVETRKLYERQKGGWLLAKVRRLTPQEVAPTPQPTLPAGGVAEVLPVEEGLGRALTAERDVTVPVPKESGRNTLAAPPALLDDTPATPEVPDVVAGAGKKGDGSEEPQA